MCQLQGGHFQLPFGQSALPKPLEIPVINQILLIDFIGYFF